MDIWTIKYYLLDNYNKQRAWLLCAVALFGKFKKRSKILASVLKTCEYDVRSSKKNLGSIRALLVPLNWCFVDQGQGEKWTKKWQLLNPKKGKLCFQL